MKWRSYTAHRLLPALGCLAMAGLALWLAVSGRGGWIIWAGVLVFGLGAAALFWEVFSDGYAKRLYPEHYHVVRFDEQGVAVTDPAESSRALSWSDLNRVIVRTTADGPFACDLFIHLIGHGGECVLPLGADGYEALLPRLQALPAVDSEALLKASTSTSDGLFVCWERSPSSGNCTHGSREDANR